MRSGHIKWLVVRLHNTHFLRIRWQILGTFFMTGVCYIQIEYLALFQFYTILRGTQEE